MIPNVLLALGIGCALGSGPSPLPPECAPGLADVEYEIVVDWREFFGSRDPRQRYDINVNRWLSRDEVEDLICCLARKLEIPEEWESVRFSFYRNLNLELALRNLSHASPEDAAAFRERVIVHYAWSRYYSERGLGGTMTIRRDGSGRVTYFEQDWDFAKSCRGWRATR